MLHSSEAGVIRIHMKWQQLVAAPSCRVDDAVGQGANVNVASWAVSRALIYVAE